MAPPRRPGWVLLSPDVHDLDKLQAAPHLNNNEPSSEWAAIRCTTTRTADAHDEHKDLVDGVTLLARVVEPPALSALAVHLRGERYEFNEDEAYVEAADDRIVVLTVTFRCRDRDICDEPQRFLVYDAADASLTAVPPLREMDCTPFLVTHPLPVRRRDDAGGYVLAIMAMHHLYDTKALLEFRREVVCLWPQPPSSRLFDGSVSPWGYKQPLFPPEKPEYLRVHTAFSFRGRAYWADLGQGILCCDFDDLLSGAHEVPFRFVPLPPECRLCELCSNNANHTFSRAMSSCPATGDGGGSGSIKLVCIGKERGSEACKTCDKPVAPGDMAVTVWAMDMITEQWRRDDGGEDLRVAELWEMEGFKAARLPRVEPILPMLCALGDNGGGGGVLCFSLNAGDYKQVHLCRLDMSTKTLLPPTVLIDDWWSSPHLCCSFLKRVEFATTPDNDDEKDVVEVLPPKRGRGEEKEEEDDVCSVPPPKRSMLPLPITSNRH